MAGPNDPGPEMVYKGDGWKIIDTTELKAALKDGWFQNPAEAKEVGLKAELKSLKAKKA